jgi:hypothetical protein
MLIGASLMCIAAGITVLMNTRDAEQSAAITSAVLATCTAFAIFGLGAIPRLRKVHRIDISGNGQIRLMETGDVDHTFDSDLAELLPDSTIWSWLMILRLRTGESMRTTILVLPDCMNSATFHQLKVACRWIAAHGAGRKS